jgi:hypothetical protein
LGPNYEDETVGCSGAWRKKNKIKTIVYWRERKEKEQGMSLWSVEGPKYFRGAEKNEKRCTRMMRKRE